MTAHDAEYLSDKEDPTMGEVMDEVAAFGTSTFVDCRGNIWHLKYLGEVSLIDRGDTEAMTCCCDSPSIVQPCGPCRCEDHEECVDND